MSELQQTSNPGEAFAGLEDLLCFDVYATSRLITRAYQPLLEHLNLTYPQYLVMVLLWEGKEHTVKSLGLRLELDSGTLSPLLKRLEQMGLITRTRLKHDEREVGIALTDLGWQKKQEAQEIPGQMACMMCITPAQAASLQKQLRDLREALKQVNLRE
ncbi:MarR family winged helix-turn-helix transcriptional regulator [Deinococcus cellulosilyticus]|uniref:Organic hydroperoxide resistance transcriptional regulator n=1 Tax=Deinococcus cellulosilyticus (strain DSM 18568 / NBRC 106333 / KACC 11606 / 5516J-15) TaxID=1223518 RepID=A0A511MZ00_DEIC1|nr:MarR family transcriptional regulator [Deinococcus cellulosilyticus]GEM45840.1 organic hydroperoxide resistance transcriptional regulator [Deinococcus cellulosilyticus NBRC 106333 = KACC 11606]